MVTSTVPFACAINSPFFLPIIQFAIVSSVLSVSNLCISQEMVCFQSSVPFVLQCLLQLILLFYQVVFELLFHGIYFLIKFYLKEHSHGIFFCLQVIFHSILNFSSVLLCFACCIPLFHFLLQDDCIVVMPFLLILLCLAGTALPRSVFSDVVPKSPEFLCLLM